MALVNMHMVKLRPDLPYMTGAEAKLFERAGKDAGISIFRQSKCERCGKFVPKPKTHCSKKCYEDDDGKK